MAEPGIPFPFKETSDREAAKKFGFDPDVEFPASTDISEIKLGDNTMSRQLGRGMYTAHAIAGVVTITAVGTAPNLNTVVQLVQLPLMVFPPRFALYFTNPTFVLPATKPFKVDAHFHTQTRLQAVQVQDAEGVHAVEVENF